MAGYDIVVLGAGSAGERVAIKLARTGRKVVAVEAGRVGGICPFVACIPSKVLLRPAHVRSEAQAGPGLALPDVDHGPLFAWRDHVVKHLDDQSRADRLKDEGVELIRGTGRLDGPGRVIVGDQTLTAEEAVIVATGAEPVIPSIAGVDTVPVLSSDELTVLETAPDELLLVGGGIIGCELAQAYAALGTEVTLLHEGSRLLDRHEPAAGRILLTALTNTGVNVVLDAEVVEVANDGEEVMVTIAGGAQHRTRNLAVVTGRRPRLHDIGLDTVDVDPRDLPLHEAFQVADGLYVIGDAAEGRYTHMANVHADVVVGAITGEGGTAVAPALLGEAAPTVTFTAPAVATVGRRSFDAEPGDVVVEADLGDTAAAATMGKGVEGAVVAVFDARRVLVGMTIVGPGAADLLHAATIAVANDLDIDQLARAVPAFPTLSGIWDVVLGKARKAFAASVSE